MRRTVMQVTIVIAVTLDFFLAALCPTTADQDPHASSFIRSCKRTTEINGF